MINEKLHLIVGELSKFGVIISFNGSFTQGIIEEIGEAMKEHIQRNKKEYDETKIYDIFSVYIEQAQNIKNYFSRKALTGRWGNHWKAAHDSIIVIGEEEDNYYVCSGNLVENDDIDELKGKIDHVNSLPHEALRKFYKEKLRERKGETVSGGLGIIEMARKSSLPLEYYIVKRDERFSFFTLKIVI